MMAGAPVVGCVLDTSALLAWLWKEPGDAAVQRALTAGGCRLSTVNLAELLAKLQDTGVPVAQGLALLSELELTFEPMSAADAAESARLRSATRSVGLSLGDRACLALAHRLGLPVLTADRAWLKAEVGVAIEFIRPVA
jgi:PIN domain nuclease of toxin-antitoxin system